MSTIAIHAARLPAATAAPAAGPKGTPGTTRPLRLFGATLVFAALCAAGQAFASDMRLLVSNHSSEDVYRIVVSPSWEGAYGHHDVLGRHVIRAGDDLVVDFDSADAEGSCVLDVMATTPAGAKWRKRMNVCTQTQWNLYD